MNKRYVSPYSEVMPMPEVQLLQTSPLNQIYVARTAKQIQGL